MAAGLFLALKADSTDPFRLARQRNQGLDDLDFQRKQLDSTADAVQRSLDLRQRRANADSAIERFPLAAIVRFSRYCATGLILGRLFANPIVWIVAVGGWILAQFVLLPSR